MLQKQQVLFILQVRNIVYITDIKLIRGKMRRDHWPLPHFSRHAYCVWDPDALCRKKLITDFSSHYLQKCIVIPSFSLLMRGACNWMWDTSLIHKHDTHGFCRLLVRTPCNVNARGLKEELLCSEAHPKVDLVHEMRTWLYLACVQFAGDCQRMTTYKPSH